MSTIVPFQFGTHEVRISLDAQGNPWWVAKDVCDILGLEQVSRALRRLKPGERGVTSITTPGGMQSMGIVNEPGLYRLIFRSDKPEAETFQSWVFEEVLPSIRKTGKYEVSTPEFQGAIPEPKTALTLIDQAYTLLTRLGHATERDTLMLADQVRNVMTAGQRVLPVSTAQHTVVSQGFSVAERVLQLGYHLTRSQQAALVPKLGKRIAEEWRQRYGNEPAKEARWVDGAQRSVAWYPPDAAEWIDTIIQSFLAGLGLLLGKPGEE